MENESKHPNIKQNLVAAKSRLKNLQQKYGRIGEKIRILAVSKNHQSDAIRQAYNAGQISFGENYLQESIQKQRDLKDLNIEWHFIGTVQSNKTRYIANNFSWVHSLERLKIARRLAEQRSDHLPPLNILIQINQQGEAKNGVDPNKLVSFSQQLLTFPNLSLRGIMYFPPKGGTLKENREKYAEMVDLARSLDTADTLSMGTSGDYEAAVAAGSTLIRLGTTIFGPRPIICKGRNGE
ncbi:MAG: YggS family pyridoxal phosphate-dependent enzyme [Pseudomonadota bacterium]|nr:YggS family pyridoxal phosphate-dependent enzyme [Pseudomonadota bacterium]